LSRAPIIAAAIIFSSLSGAFAYFLRHGAISATLLFHDTRRRDTTPLMPVTLFFQLSLLHHADTIDEAFLSPRFHLFTPRRRRRFHCMPFIIRFFDISSPPFFADSADTLAAIFFDELAPETRKREDTMMSFRHYRLFHFTIDDFFISLFDFCCHFRHTASRRIFAPPFLAHISIEAIRY
jgi:hypothetical protein